MILISSSAQIVLAGKEGWLCNHSSSLSWVILSIFFLSWLCCQAKCCWNAPSTQSYQQGANLYTTLHKSCWVLTLCPNCVQWDKFSATNNLTVHNKHKTWPNQIMFKNTLIWSTVLDHSSFTVSVTKQRNQAIDTDVCDNN